MAYTDTFQPTTIISHKLLDPVMASSFTPRSSNGAFHGHIRDSAHAAFLSPLFIEDLDILDGPDALLFFDQEALLGDACHFDEQRMAQELSPSSTWTLDELYDQEGVQNTSSTPAFVPGACTHYTPSSSHTEQDTLQHKQTPQASKLCSVSSSGDKSSEVHPISKLSLANNASKHVDDDAMDGDDDGSKATHSGKASPSKNIVSERKRRRKLNERLYSLRALVPKISKMDKASIVNDAIDYVQKLQKLVKDMEGDIHTLQTRAGGDKVEAFRYVKGRVTSAWKEVDYKILKVDVTKMEEATYHLRILCLKGRGVFVKLAKALEALQLEIVNANLTSVSDHILNTIVLKAKDGRSMEPRDLREMILELVPRFGLGLAKEG